MKRTILPSEHLRSGVFRLLLIVFLAALSFSFVFADEASTIRRFERARRSEPELIAFLKNMPKGADLHNHVAGAVYAETGLDHAVSGKFYFDTRTSLISRQEGPNSVPSSDLLTRPDLNSQFLDAASMRKSAHAIINRHDHFFSAFNVIGSALQDLDSNDALFEVISRAKGQNLQYMELMTNIVPGFEIKSVMQNPPPLTDMEKALEALKPRFPGFLSASRVFLDERDRILARRLGIQGPVTGTGGPINIRYIFSVNRLSPNETFFAAVACGMAVVQNDSRVVAINIVAPEDDPRSRLNFEAQMRIFDFLWQRFGKPNLTLHAGELTLQYSPLEPMHSRIRRTIEKGHARRIGHGVSIAWEDGLSGLLRQMKKRGIAVEICLTSNENILDVKGPGHPFSLYRNAGVPLMLCTDDEGVNRSNLTVEFVKAVRRYDLSYRDVKELALNSLEYSFLPGISLYAGRDYSKVRPEFSRLRELSWTPSQREKGLMKSSDKLTLQVRLERAFVDFEK